MNPKITNKPEQNQLCDLNSCFLSQAAGQLENEKTAFEFPLMKLNYGAYIYSEGKFYSCQLFQFTETSA